MKERKESEKKNHMYVFFFKEKWKKIKKEIKKKKKKGKEMVKGTK